MSYDLFLGLPGHRVIRSPDIAAYYNFEKAHEQPVAGADRPGIPSPVQLALLGMLATWPKVKCTYYKSSVLLAFEERVGQAAQDRLASLVHDYEIVHINRAVGGWFDAQRPSPDARHLPGYTSERCVIKYYCRADRALLFDPDWFVDGRFFVLAVNPEHYLQIIKSPQGVLIEYRSGEGRPLYRSRPVDIELAGALFEGYVSGRDMSKPEYGFGAVMAGPDSDKGLPERDPTGRWVPPEAQPIGAA